MTVLRRPWVTGASVLENGIDFKPKCYGLVILFLCIDFWEYEDNFSFQVVHVRRYNLHFFARVMVNCVHKVMDDV